MLLPNAREGSPLGSEMVDWWSRRALDVTTSLELRQRFSGKTNLRNKLLKQLWIYGFIARALSVDCVQATLQQGTNDLIPISIQVVCVSDRAPPKARGPHSHPATQKP